MSVSLIASGCVQHRFSDHYELTPSPVARTAQATPEADGEPAESELAPFVARLARPGAIFGPQDQEYFQALKERKGERSDLLEAAIAVGILHSALKTNFDTPSFAEADLFTKPQRLEVEDPGTSLGKLAQEYDFNLAYALEHNVFLQSHGIHALVVDAIAAGRDDEDYELGILRVVRNNWHKWQRLRLPESLLGPAEPPPGDEAAATTPPPEDHIKPALPFRYHEMRDAEEILRESQTLADQDRYEEAIQVLGMVDAGSLLHPTAQEKVKEFSNLAVQDLRRRAARSFQNAIPVTDFKARSSYLEEAQKYLTLALQRFPDADHIETVRQNLTVINKNLDVLRSRSASYREEP